MQGTGVSVMELSAFNAKLPVAVAAAAAMCGAGVRCGERSHMVEFDYGSRSCDGDTDLDGMCNANANAGEVADPLLLLNMSLASIAFLFAEAHPNAEAPPETQRLLLAHQRLCLIHAT